jgi:DNA-binding GntR family transcriptional regulator
VGTFDPHPPLARTATSAAAELIKQAIVDGRVKPGQRLKEERLARELGISRTPVREALLILQSEGLVDSSPNRGATVRSYDVEDLDDMYQLRALLEGYAARRAATRITDEGLSILDESCARFERLRAHEDLQELVRENFLFHTTIHEAAGSQRLAVTMRQVIEMPLAYRSYIWYSKDQTRISQHYHRQLARALRARDGERAEAIMREHVLEARDVLVANLREEREAGG